MKQHGVILFLSLMVGACSTLDSTDSSFSSEMVERVGLLAVQNSEECLLAQGCGPQFSLLDQDMRSRKVVLVGNVDANMQGHLIAVQGHLSRAPLSATQSVATMDVKRALSVTQLKYQDFLGMAARGYLRETYGCLLFWDEVYRWRLEGRQPFWVITLNNGLSEHEDEFIELTYDGVSGELQRERKSAETLDPCN